MPTDHSSGSLGAGRHAREMLVFRGARFAAVPLHQFSLLWRKRSRAFEVSLPRLQFPFSLFSFFAYSFASQLFEFSLQCCTLASLSIPFPLLYELFVSRQPRCSTQCEPSFVPTQQDAPACTRQENAVDNLTSGRSAHKNSDKLDSNFSV